MLPGQMMVRVDVGFVEPEDIQNIEETLQKKVSAMALHWWQLWRDQVNIVDFFYAVSTKNTKYTEVQKPIFYQCFFVSSPSKPFT